MGDREIGPLSFAPGYLVMTLKDKAALGLRFVEIIFGE
jgi:hypothetical protein